MALVSESRIDHRQFHSDQDGECEESGVDAYFSADVETDGPIPGPFSILSFSLVYAGSFDGKRFERQLNYNCAIYKESSTDLDEKEKPISECFEIEALLVNGLDRADCVWKVKIPKTL